MKVLIAGGGTGGHINPGVAIARYINEKNNDAEILFVGTARGLETKLVPREGFKLELIKVRGFKRKLSAENLTAIKELFQGLLQAGRIIKKFKPDLVIGTGGYVCGPVLFMAARKKIPTVIHEQNAFPGVTNRILSRYVDAVAISFKEAEKFFDNAKKLQLTGNPVRPELLKADRAAARGVVGVVKDDPFIVIFGGSLGAGKINSAATDMLLNHYKKGDFKLMLATGNNQYDSVVESLKDFKSNDVNVTPYIYNAAEVFSAADLIVCRAGAITCSELTALGIPSIMIPSPNVTANHQEHNARALENQGASVVILDKDLSGKLLYDQIKDLLNDREQLAKMARNAKKAGITNAVDRIYSIIIDVMKSRGK